AKDAERLVSLLRVQDSNNYKGCDRRRSQNESARATEISEGVRGFPPFSQDNNQVRGRSFSLHGVWDFSGNWVRFIALREHSSRSDLSVHDGECWTSRILGCQ